MDETSPPPPSFFPQQVSKLVEEDKFRVAVEVSVMGNGHEAVELGCLRS